MIPVGPDLGPVPTALPAELMLTKLALHVGRAPGVVAEIAS